MKCDLSIDSTGRLVVTDEDGYPMCFDIQHGAWKALERVIRARNASPNLTPKFNTEAKPSAEQILTFMRDKKQTEIKRRAAIADEILATLDLDLDL